MAELSKSNSLQAARPDLIKEWHPTKNGNLSLNGVTMEYQSQVWWLCEKGHAWQASVLDRVRGQKCIFCKDLINAADQRMVEIQPALLKEWHPSHNAGLRAKDIRCDYTPEVWWICDQSHEWKDKILNRIEGAGCPLCGNSKPRASSGRNDMLSPRAPSERGHGQCIDHTTLAFLQESISDRYGVTDSRKSSRYGRSQVVMLEKADSEILGYAELRNFSASGMMLSSNFSIRQGELIRIRLDRPLYHSASTVLTSKVIWCHDLKDWSETITRFAIGVNF